MTKYKMMIWLFLLIWLALFLFFARAWGATTDGITITFPSGHIWRVNTRSGDLYCESSPGVSSCELLDSGYYRWTDTTEGSRGLYFSRGNKVPTPPPTPPTPTPPTPPTPEPTGLTAVQLDQVNAAIEARLATIPLCDPGVTVGEAR